jgi:hypothetical protein
MTVVPALRSYSRMGRVELVMKAAQAPVGTFSWQAALQQVPPVVPAARRSRRLEVDLFPCPLADVADVQVACRAVEAEPPGVAQPEGPDLVAGAAREVCPAGTGSAAHEGVGGGNAVERRGRLVDVDAQDLAQQDAQVLPVLPGIPPAAAVTDRGVEEGVRPERDLATVVIAELRVRDHEQDALGSGIGDVRVAAHRVACDHDVAGVA